VELAKLWMIIIFITNVCWVRKISGGIIGIRLCLMMSKQIQYLIIVDQKMLSKKSPCRLKWILVGGHTLLLICSDVIDH
jgi:hypothetical protein